MYHVAGDIAGLQRSERLLSTRSLQVVVFHVLKMVLANAVESLITMDRLSYLEEHGIVAKVVPLFDPSISPRNLAVIGARKPCTS